LGLGSEKTHSIQDEMKWMECRAAVGGKWRAGGGYVPKMTRERTGCTSAYRQANE